MTLWVDDESTGLPPKAATGQLTLILVTCQTCWSPLQQTTNDKPRPWQRHGDSPFHVGLPTFQGSFGVNFGIDTSTKSSCQTMSVWDWCVTGKQDIIPDVICSYHTWCPCMKSPHSKSYAVSLISVKHRLDVSICWYCLQYHTPYPIKNVNIGWQRGSYLNIWPDIKGIFTRYRRKLSTSGPILSGKEE